MTGTPVAADLSLVLSAPKLNNGGTNTIAATVTAVDANRNALAGIPVTVRVDSSAVATVSSTTTNAQGQVVAAVGIGAVYGGFFGAGLGVMLLAVLGIALDGTLNEANAMKQLLSLATNATAAVLFLFSGRVYWWVALVMAVAAMVGGYTGGRLADKLDAARFRIVVVIAGAVLTVVYAVKVWG